VSWQQPVVWNYRDNSLKMPKNRRSVIEKIRIIPFSTLFEVDRDLVQPNHESGDAGIL
jgi:hypothetical protein